MSKPILSPARCLSTVLKQAGWAVLIIALLSLPSLAQGQLPADYERDRQRAFQLIDEKKLIEALPLLEKLAAAKPDDRVVLERLGLVLATKSITSTDADERKKLRLRAREVLLRAKQLGDNSNLLQTLLDGLPEDGSDSTFSGRKEIDDATDVTR